MPRDKVGKVMEEKSFFSQGNVSVSNARFIVDGQTYAMNGVTSVKTGRKAPSRWGPIIVGVVGLASLGGGEAGAVILGLVLIGLAIFWWVKQKPELSVVLSSSSGEMRALVSRDAAFINGVIEALNNAIIHRG